jgi:branched-chain amino acid transport system permease protein
VTALSLIAFAYAGGITLISGAVFAGLISAQALIPYALDKWFGLNGNWFLLFGGVILIFTLLQNPPRPTFARLAFARLAFARLAFARLAFAGRTAARLASPGPTGPAVPRSSR